MIIPKWIGVKPVSKVETYLKYGLVFVETEYHYCPRCKRVLNAGPDYQPKYCSECGQKVKFESIKWRKEIEIGFKERGEADEPLKN